MSLDKFYGFFRNTLSFLNRPLTIIIRLIYNVTEQFQATYKISKINPSTAIVSIDIHRDAVFVVADNPEQGYSILTGLGSLVSMSLRPVRAFCFSLR